MKRSPRKRCAICQCIYFRPLLSINRLGQDFSIVRCGDCYHTFVADPPADTANHVDINKIDWAFRPRHHQIRRMLLRHLKPGQRVLEIGCGRGEIGYLLRHDPFEYTGFEPADGLSDFGIRAGVPITKQVYAGGLRADAVIVDNVLEHVLEPQALLAMAAASLNPDGLLILITPNVNDIRARSKDWRDRHLWVPPDHVNFFSARDMKRLFKAVSLAPQRFGFSPLGWLDYRFFPRAIAENLHLSIFGHNLYAVK